MEEQKTDKIAFELKKVAGGKCQLITHTPDLERVETVSEAFVKNMYREMREQKLQVEQQVSKVTKELKDNTVEKDIELEHFIELANAANRYHKMMKAEADLKATLKMLDNITDGMKPIEIAYPEVKRMKK